MSAPDLRTAAQAYVEATTGQTSRSISRGDPAFERIVATREALRAALAAEATEPLPTVKVGVASMLARDGLVLVGKRLGAHGEGMWSVPGGHPEFGESWAETAAREALEETGLTMMAPRFVAVTNDVEPGLGTHYVTLWMLGQCLCGEPTETEPDRFVDQRWVSLDDLPEPLFWPWDQLLLSEFMPAIRSALAGPAPDPQGADEPKRCPHRSPMTSAPCVLPVGHQIRHASPQHITGRQAFRERWGGGEEYPGDVEQAQAPAAGTPGEHHATISLRWQPSASIGEYAAIEDRLLKLTGYLTDLLGDWGVTEASVKLDMQPAGAPGEPTDDGCTPASKDPDAPILARPGGEPTGDKETNRG